MKAVLEFQLPEEQEEFTRAANVSLYMLALVDLSTFLRTQCKYADLSEEQKKVYEAVRAEFYAALDRYRIGDIP